MSLGVATIMPEHLKNFHLLVAASHLDRKEDSLDDDGGSPPAKLMATKMVLCRKDSRNSSFRMLRTSGMPLSSL